MINGPAGDQRSDIQFAYLRQFVGSANASRTLTYDECALTFDYRDYFAKEMDAEKDFEYLQKRFGGSKAK